MNARLQLDSMRAAYSRWRVLALLAAVAVALVVEAGMAGDVRAQSCRTDFDCYQVGGGNRCLGDVLVTYRRVCLAGRCQAIQTGRINCGAPTGGGRCVGNTWVRSGGGCDALSGRCRTGSQIQVTCVKSCACRRNRLIISTGQCTPGIGCARTAVMCKTGCTCSPEPRCLEDPVPKGAKQR